MATVYRAPIDPPVMGRDDWKKSDDGTGHWVSESERKETAYIAELAAKARRNGSNPLLGKVIRWQRADGYAQYMVWSTKPLQLVHLNLGDGYGVESALIRGLRLADVKAMVELDEKWEALFAEKAKA